MSLTNNTFDMDKIDDANINMNPFILDKSINVKNQKLPNNFQYYDGLLLNVNYLFKSDIELIYKHYGYHIFNYDKIEKTSKDECVTELGKHNVYSIEYLTPGYILPLIFSYKKRNIFTDANFKDMRFIFDVFNIAEIIPPYFGNTKNIKYLKMYECVNNVYTITENLDNMILLADSFIYNEKINLNIVNSSIDNLLLMFNSSTLFLSNVNELSLDLFSCVSSVESLNYEKNIILAFNNSNSSYVDHIYINKISKYTSFSSNNANVIFDMSKDNKINNKLVIKDGCLSYGGYYYYDSIFIRELTLYGKNVKKIFLSEINLFDDSNIVFNIDYYTSNKLIINKYNSNGKVTININENSLSEIQFDGKKFNHYEMLMEELDKNKNIKLIMKPKDIDSSKYITNYNIKTTIDLLHITEENFIDNVFMCSNDIDTIIIDKNNLNLCFKNCCVKKLVLNVENYKSLILESNVVIDLITSNNNMISIENIECINSIVYNNDIKMNSSTVKLIVNNYRDKKDKIYKISDNKIINNENIIIITSPKYNTLKHLELTNYYVDYSINILDFTSIDNVIMKNVIYHDIIFDDEKHRLIGCIKLN